MNPKALAVFIPLVLMAGLATGLAKLGIVPIPGAHLHGLLMLNGFTGGLITVERTLSKPIPSNFFALVLLEAGIVLALLDYSWGLWLVTGAVLLLLTQEVRAYQKSQWFYHTTQIIGLLCWLTANVKYQFGGFYPLAIPFWQAFILMMILATRLKNIDRINDRLMMLGMWSYVALICLPFHGIATYLSGGVLLLVGARALWLELKTSPDSAYRLIIVYGWLIATAIGILMSDFIFYSYDLVIHCFFLGFLFNMIFLNASKAVVSKLGVKNVPLAEGVWIIIMTVGLLLRVVAGDLLEVELAKEAGGIISVLAILGFLGSVIRAVVLTRRS
ncbi:MAG: hypothetical protein RIF33_13030 [Cyclobacteriaceae bacterium]